MPYIRGQKDASDVGVVSLKRRDWLHCGHSVALHHSPDVNIDLCKYFLSAGETTEGPNSGSKYRIVPCTEEATITCNSDTGHGDVLLWIKLLCAEILAKIPNLYTACAVTGDQLPLVWMYYNIVDGTLVIIDSLDASILSMPHLYKAIFRTRHNPLPFTMELHTRNVSGVARESHDRLWIGRLHIEKFYIVIAGCGKKSFIRGDAESIDLRIRMLDCTGADARQSFPESNCVIIASCRQILLGVGMVIKRLL